MKKVKMQELERIALYIERMHDRLMDIYFSLKNTDGQTVCKPL